MRQYRGLTKEGKWVYGFHYVLQSRYFIIPSDKDIDIGWTDTDFVESFIEVIPETVGQSTGLKDKFGTEIYEGDIVKFRNEKYQVVFSSGSFLLNILPDAHAQIWVYHNECEIIGNIHEEAKE